MNLLLDTHIAIWFITNDTRLPAATKQAIEHPENSCYVSIATHWELAIKHSLGKLELHAELKRIFELMEESGLELLPITSVHALAIASLPFHHRDPFDRLLIAQALTENLTICTVDKVFSLYEAKLIQASD